MNQNRNVDLLTGTGDLEDLPPMVQFPVFIGTTEREIESDIFADMMWSISRSSGLIQLKNLLPLHVLYQEQTTTSAVGSTWMQHHQEFAKFLHSCQPESVLEIGGAHGILSFEYDRIRKLPWTIIEPNPKPVKDCKAVCVRSFFDSKTELVFEFDTVVHSHVLEHMYDPMGFFASLSQKMRDGKKMVFSVPNMIEWFKRKYTNCINFEHTLLLTEPHIEYLLSHNGFRITRKENFGDCHSIFFEVVKDSKTKKTKLSNNLYYENLQLYHDYMTYFSQQVRTINEQTSSLRGKVYLFGAHVFSQALLSFGLESDRITCILDNDRCKDGKRLYGSHLRVSHPESIRDEVSPTIILRAGVYESEIREQILGHVNDSAVFI